MVTAVVFSVTLTEAVAPPHRSDDRIVVVDRGDRHADRLGVGAAEPVVGLDGDVVDVVGASIGRRFIVRGGQEAQRPGNAIDGEQRRVRTPNDAVVHRLRGQVGVGGRDGGHGRGVLGHVERGRSAAAVRSDDRVVVVDRRDRHADGLGVGATRAIVGLDGDVVDVVGAGIGRRFMVGGGQEAQGAGDAVDGE
ncbi:MAG: hypothetical protein R3E48_11600 [Burkholderiaceae bacterium]